MKNIIFVPLTLQLPIRHYYCENCIFNRCHICHLRLHGTTFYHCYSIKNLDLKNTGTMSVCYIFQ